MMLPLPKFDISKAPHPHFVGIFMPILPGGVLCIGLALYRPAITALLTQQSQLNFVFTAYVCGLVLDVVNVAVLGNAALLLGAGLGAAVTIRTGKTDSRNRIWRIAALQYLGPAFVRELQPADEAAVFQQRFKERLEAITREGTPDAGAKVLNESIKVIEQVDADKRWEQLHTALTTMFYRQPEFTNAISVTGAVQSVGVACIILACATDVPQPRTFWIIGLIAVIATFLLFAFYGFQVGQGQAGQIQLSNILRELKKPSSIDGNASQPST